MANLKRADVGSRIAWRKMIRKNAVTIPTTPAIVVDENLASLLATRSLGVLPPGVIGVKGEFLEGAEVSILDPCGKRLGIALVEYGSHDILDIMGHHSGQIAELIGKYRGPSITHRKLYVWHRDSSIASPKPPLVEPGQT
jgi:glutamate 5-kinase